MMLRILFTLAILAGLAVAPGAEQRFDWQAGGHHETWSGDLADRVERLVANASRVAERMAERMASRMERTADRVAARAEQQADRIRARVETRVEDRLRHVERHVWSSRGASSRLDQGSIGDDPCRDADRWDDDDYRHCEVREIRLPAGPLTVDANRNGGIRVEGWDGNDVLVRAVVQARGRDEASAKQMGSQVEIQTGSGRVTAVGPSSSGREWWSVSYRISVPRRTDLDLNARNGGISVGGVTGSIRFDTTNGGVRLTDLAGHVTGRTRNGGVNVALSGSRWEGEGLDVETSNGGVTLAIPSPYDARLETRTVNGGFRFDYPLTLTGELSPRRGISTQLGAGGALVRVQTRNGAVKIERR